MVVQNAMSVGQAGPGLAFTLDALLVLIAINAVLASSLLPAPGRSKANAGAARCINNLRQLHIAWAQGAGNNDDMLPCNLPAFCSGVAASELDLARRKAQTRLQPNPSAKLADFPPSSHRARRRGRGFGLGKQLAMR